MDAGELEFSAHTLSHQDPVGMDFDLNSISQVGVCNRLLIISVERSRNLGFDW